MVGKPGHNSRLKNQLRFTPAGTHAARFPAARHLWYNSTRSGFLEDIKGELVELANFDHILKTLKERKPYRPFTVALVNGDRFEVDHPDALVVRDGVAVYIAAGGVPVLFDHAGVGQFIGDLMGQWEFLTRPCCGAVS